MTASLTIRPVESGDVSAWRDLWTQYLEFYQTTVSEDVYTTSFARLLNPDVPDLNGLMALNGERPVGLVHYIFHRHMWRQDDVCYLQDLYTAPDMRRAGIGHALINTVYARAQAAGAPQVYWLTQSDNTPARRLYDQIAELTPFVKYQRRSS